ncbi:putative glycoside hydrolase family 79 protein [Neofusicoccum parvum]|uniref:Glycoside hydrolase family 79 protein n=1 Tax=Neofusicoccum parvum TaxID=310453 RepID=A0ACB5RZR6_9PEZI|nr:putative glycoside hydrolase family 79 protein [Neofusicoccum parvum]
MMVPCALHALWRTLLPVSCFINSVLAAYDEPQGRVATAMTLDPTPGKDAGPALPEAFVSYAFEFSSFPDFAGNSTSGPNLFSDQLLNNIGNITGTKPYIRVGGNTQDYAVYDPSLPVALVGVIDPERQPNYPTNVTVGPSFFESYATWPGARYVHGFNLARSNGTYGDEDLLGPVEPACRALGIDDRLLYWEVGNEVDVYNRGRFAVRPPGWDEADYVAEWLNATRRVRARMGEACPELATDERFKLWAPSYGGTDNGLDAVRPWQDGIDADGNVVEVSMHFYMSGYGLPGITLQGTLLNHTNTAARLAPHLNVSRALAAAAPGVPYALTEVNSLYNAGQPDVSNVFGAALWTLDFNLWCAANGVARVHMQQGLNFRYASWQPRDTGLAPKGTRPPYYGDVAVASAVGDLTRAEVRVRSLRMESETDAAYATYGDGVLRRVVLINMQTYNYSTAAGEGAVRPGRVYAFGVPAGCGGEAGAVTVQRLMANGSDAVTGVTFNGVSYNWELDEGRPVVQGNVTRDESLGIEEDGIDRSVPSGRGEPLP